MRGEISKKWLPSYSLYLSQNLNHSRMIAHTYSSDNVKHSKHVKISGNTNVSLYPSYDKKHLQKSAYIIPSSIICQTLQPHYNICLNIQRRGHTSIYVHSVNTCTYENTYIHTQTHQSMYLHFVNTYTCMHKIWV